MAWENLKEFFFIKGSEFVDAICPECGGRVKFTSDLECGEYTMQCDKCYTMIRGYRSKAP